MIISNIDAISWWLLQMMRVPCSQRISGFSTFDVDSRKVDITPKVGSKM